MYTKGTWGYSNPNPNTQSRVIKVKYSTGNIGTVGYVSCHDVDMNRDPMETLANARLIAAAPDLLEALEGLKTRAAKLAEQIDPEGEGEVWGWIEEATNAISKAKGE